MINMDQTIHVGTINEPNLWYETNEFVIRWAPLEGQWWAGSDSGCSCYDGMSIENYFPYREVREIRPVFSSWISTWRDGVGLEAAAWESFNAATKNLPV